MRRLRLLTAGESHGPGMSGILDGLPAGLRVSTREVDRDLARRQHGYGSGRRMQIERDRVDVERRAALRADARLAARLQRREPRLGRAGPSGCRSSPSPRAGDPGPSRWPGRVTRTSRVPSSTTRPTSGRSWSVRRRDPRHPGSLRAPSAVSCSRRAACHGLELRRPAGTHPGVPGRGRPARPDRRRLVAARPDRPHAAALPGPGRRGGHDGRGGRRHRGGRFHRRQLRGRGRGDAHRRRLERRVGHPPGHRPRRRDHGHPGGQGRRDRPRLRRRSRDAAAPSTTRSTRARPSWGRRSNRAGGVEGGMSNGEPIVVRVPRSSRWRRCASRSTPWTSTTGQPGRAHIERSDVAILPRAAVVGEAMISLVVADALLADVRWRHHGRPAWPRCGGAARRSRGPRGAAVTAAEATDEAPVVVLAAGRRRGRGHAGRSARTHDRGAPVRAPRPGHRLFGIARR